MTLLICPVRLGDDNEELRYALRSWETNLLMGGLTLWTVGYRPAWLTPDRHLEGNHHESITWNVFDNIRIASAATSWRYDWAYYMNDDFFCLDPITGIPQVKRNITLAEHCALAPAGQGMWWGDSLALTAELLAEAGFPRPDSFEVHRPLAASPRLMYEVLRDYQLGSHDAVPQWRTLYGVQHGQGARPVPDVKISNKVAGIGSPWISSSDTSWRRLQFSIASRFTEPSRWER